jgi:polyferredoxin
MGKENDGVHNRIDLLEKFPTLKKIVKMRSFQFLVLLPNLALFLLFLLTGIFGNPIGNQNMMIIFVWILWWVVLIAVLVPFGSRIWCTMCPLPAPGEWLERLTFAGVKKKSFSLNKKWPKALRNIWLQNIGFLMLALFSALLVTRPIVSVLVLGGMIILAIILHLIYEKRSFCMYLCPVSGFLGLYAMFSSLELRVKDKEVCRKHKEKECLRGSEAGYGCPWFQYVGNMERNNYCGLCTECIKTCPKDNIAINIRPFAADVKLKSYDEAWKAFIMLTLAMAYSLVLLGSSGTLKDWANVTVSGDWAGFATYAGLTVLTALVFVPAVFAVFSWLAKALANKKEVPFSRVFIEYSYVLVPMGLLAWIAFSVPLLLINGSYIISILSDPFGWGWNLFGTKDFPWTPFASGLVPYIQIVALLTGLVVSIVKGHEVARNLFNDHVAATRSLVPIAVLLLGVTAAFLKLFTG